MSARAAVASARSRRSEALSEIRRVEILSAATLVFGRKGFEATRAEDIADAAGIAKGTLYLYFKSKEAVYSAAVSLAVSQLRTELDRDVGEAVGFQGKLQTALETRLAFWTRYQSIYSLLLTVGRGQKHRKQTAKFLRAAQHDYLELLQKAVETGEFACDDLEQLAWATLDLVRGASERRIDKLGNSDPHQDALRITAFILSQDKRRDTITRRR